VIATQAEKNLNRRYSGRQGAARKNQRPFFPFFKAEFEAAILPQHVEGFCATSWQKDNIDCHGFLLLSDSFYRQENRAAMPTPTQR
jgi:hypothetical protein